MITNVYQERMKYCCYRIKGRRVFSHRLRIKSVSYLEIDKRACTCRRFDPLAYFCTDAGRTSRRANTRAGPPHTAVVSRPARWRKKKNKRPTSCRVNGLQLRRELENSVRRSHASEYDTYIYIYFVFSTSLSKIVKSVCRRRFPKTINNIL